MTVRFEPVVRFIPCYSCWSSQRFINAWYRLETLCDKTHQKRRALSAVSLQLRSVFDSPLRFLTVVFLASVGV